MTLCARLIQVQLAWWTGLPLHVIEQPLVALRLSAGQSLRSDIVVGSDSPIRKPPGIARSDVCNPADHPLHTLYVAKNEAADAWDAKAQKGERSRRRHDGACEGMEFLIARARREVGKLRLSPFL